MNAKKALKIASTTLSNLDTSEKTARYTKAYHPVEIAEMQRVGQDEEERTGMGGWEQPGPESEYEEYVRTTLVPSTYP